MTEIRRISRGRKLTQEEAVRYRAVRKKIAAEMPVILEERRVNDAVVKLMDELRSARESNGLSLADIQQSTGMDRSAVSKLENGERSNPTLETLMRYAAAVGKRIVLNVVDAS